MKNTKFKSGQDITTFTGAITPGKKSKGRITGWAGYSKESMRVRVEWEDGEVSDYLPSKLEAIVESIE